MFNRNAGLPNIFELTRLLMIQPCPFNLREGELNGTEWYLIAVVTPGASFTYQIQLKILSLWHV